MLTASHRRTLAVAIVATAALGENHRSALHTALGFLRRLRDAVSTELRLQAAEYPQGNRIRLGVAHVVERA